MTSTLVPHKPFILPEQIPSLEVLDARPVTLSDIFPPDGGDDPTGPLGEYGWGADPTPSSPLCLAVQQIQYLRKEARANPSVTKEDAKRITYGTVFQHRLIGWLNRGYENLVRDGISPLEATYDVEGYIEERDQQKSEEYRDNIRKMEGLALVVEEGLPIPEDNVGNGFAPEADERDAEPISPELQREACMRAVAQDLELNHRLLKRLNFEWLTSVIAIKWLRESLTDGIHTSKLLALT